MLTPHDIQCRPSDSSLPDGRWLYYQRNGQGQVTALVHSPVQRPWLRNMSWLRQHGYVFAGLGE